MERHSGFKTKEILPFVATWMNLENIIRSGISQAQKKTPHDLTYMWNLGKSKSSKQRVEPWLPGIGEIVNGYKVSVTWDEPVLEL